MMNRVWELLDKKDLPEGVKIITLTWACRKKSNGTYHSRLNARRFKQIAVKHFNPTSTAAPVTNDTTIRILLVLMLLMNWTARIYDVKGVFLKEIFICHKAWNTTIGVWQY